MDMRF